MTNYEKAIALWQQKNIRADAELAEVLNGHGIAFAYHSGKIENGNITYHDTREIFAHDGNYLRSADKDRKITLQQLCSLMPGVSD